jgi:GntR family transcriptional regulator, arabinose operon transcriptional repressor
MSNNDALYVKIKNDIEQGIQTGKYPADFQLPTENEIARRYDVSRITVSKAMSELKEAGIVIRYPGRGTYISKNAADILSSLNEAGNHVRKMEPRITLHKIVLIIPSVADRFCLSIISGIQKALTADKYQLHVIASNSADGEAFAIAQSIDADAKGIILFPMDQEYYSDEVLNMKINKFPFVLIDRPFPGVDTNYAISDNFLGGQIAAAHLLELNHRNIAFLTQSNQSTYTVENRLSGCKSEIGKYQDRSLTVIESLDISKPHDYYVNEFNDLIFKKGITAFITSESQMAIYLYCLLKTMGIRVPNDVSHVTFDDPISNIQDFMFFTHVDQHGDMIGYTAGSIIRNMLTNANGEETTRKEIIVPSLVVSKSTGRL